MKDIRMLSVIVARKGSKGLPSKCMLPIAGMPVVEHVICWATSIRFHGVDHTVVVSSDIIELKEIAKRYGALFIERDKDLASDTAPIDEVVLDALKRMGVGAYDYISLLYGNIPIRYNELIMEPLFFLEENTEFKGVLTFQRVEKYNPAWMVKLTEKRLPVWREEAFRRQDLDQYMIHDGHTCLTRADFFVESMERANRDNKGFPQMYRTWGGTYIKPWLHDKIVIDIDTEKDYKLARCVIEYCHLEYQYR
ncbi:N-Acetylneuraminate cytidylyltransferase [Dissulfuribacter thermophilus]|uniref:N-Acetylneuraminate cytidylyltransferase n=1 Tax=Dissulfuribacter thermophilus TaxID=1156395 RepID=A0A1B9F2U6_9BACT|nr:hypothetical protein [Dissulfuribacter thermophilus]OCC14154.1 N-Acetylneuraminate cytidylyltransferase [Dissulfuribacter thermophilus]